MNPLGIAYKNNEWPYLVVRTDYFFNSIECISFCFVFFFLFEKSTTNWDIEVTLLVLIAKQCSFL